jgi:hypothetical protein
VTIGTANTRIKPNSNCTRGLITTIYKGKTTITRDTGWMPSSTRQCGFLTNTCGEWFFCIKAVVVFAVNFFLIIFFDLTPR